MHEYHKIQTVYKRDPETKYKTLLEGEWSMPEFGYLADNRWVFTEKVDGTNIRVMWNGIDRKFGGRTERSQFPGGLLDVLDTMFPVGLLERQFGADPACLYGEGYGAGIQKGGGNYRPDKSFVLFDVRVGDWWLQRDDVVDIGGSLGVETVPILVGGTLADLVGLVSDGFESQWGGFQAEGVVARPVVELQDRAGRRIITKLKCKDFPKEGE